MPALEELEKGFEKYLKDEEFKKELSHYLKEFAGRPTPLYYAENLTKKLGVKIYLKREDLVHGGAHAALHDLRLFFILQLKVIHANDDLILRLNVFLILERRFLDLSLDKTGHSTD